MLCKLRRLEVCPIFTVQIHYIGTFSSVSFSSILVVLMFYFQQGGQCELEVVGKKGVVQLNGRPINPGTKVSLTGGDEVIFSSCRRHAYVSYHNFLIIQPCSFSISFFITLAIWSMYFENGKLSYIALLFP
jgi:hypothetical protein